MMLSKKALYQLLNAMIMNKYFEKQLPDGYIEVGKMDPKECKILKIVSSVLMIIFICLGFILFDFNKIILDIRATKTTTVILYFALYILVLFTHVIFHELIHGVIYKIYTHEKLVFGWYKGCAYCGVPDIYVYRHCAIISLMGPFVILSITFILLVIFIKPLVLRFLFYVLLVIIQNGCIFDLYDFYLLMTRFKSGDTIIYDNGPIQYFYAKNVIIDDKGV